MTKQQTNIIKGVAILMMIFIISSIGWDPTIMGCANRCYILVNVHW